MEIVKYLLEHGADNISYALRTASKRGYSEIFNCLLKNGSGYINEALLDAIINENLELVKYLVEHGADVNAKYDNGSTVLMEASVYGTLEIVKYLVENGAENINKALMIVSSKGYLEIVKYLIQNGADVNIEDYQCNTALDFTTNEEIIKILKEAGAM